MRNFLWLVILVGMVLFSWKMYTEHERCCHQIDTPTKVAETINPTAVPIAAKAACTTGYVCFADNSCDPIFADSFNRHRDSILTLIRNRQKLTITGHYQSSETYAGSSSDLGICRAETIRRRFGSSLADDQVALSSQRIVGRVLASYDRITYSIGAADKVVEDKTLIYFPYNSIDKLSDSEIERYLDDVAERVISSGERVQLTGHTDSKGDAEYNIGLGRSRAVVIRNYLTSKGVTPNKIVVRSEGETAKVATNATSEGRAQNRRTELQIIK
jgi:OOP family OmpA-OmpF porin